MIDDLKERNIYKVIITGGGTGGHLSPAIGFCKILKKNNIYPYLITDKRCEKYLPKNFDIDFSIIDIKKPSYSFLNFFSFCFSLLKALYSSFSIFVRLKPKFIIACGGYTTLPIIIIAFLTRRKIILHEQNSIFGKANRYMAPISYRIFTSFEKTSKSPKFNQSKIIYTGNPVTVEKEYIKKEIKEINDFTILVTGGSQGAAIFDLIIPNAIGEFHKKNPSVNLKIFQQVKGRDIDDSKSIYDSYKIKYELSDYFYNIDQIYQKTNLLIARSGAGTIFEAIAYGIPAIYIPYPHASDQHQLHNALFMHDKHVSWILEQSELSKDKLASMLEKIILSDKLLQNAKKRIKHLKVNTEEIILNEINKIIDKR